MTLDERGWTIEPMTATDLDDVTAIEVAAHPTPWPRNLFANELDLNWSQLDVLRNSDGILMGYIDFWYVHDELHLLNIAIAPAFRRQGCARALLDHLFTQAIAHHALYITLEVRVTNHGAIKLYENLHFEVIGRRRGYYSDTGEDALIMARLLEAPL